MSSSGKNFENSLDSALNMSQDEIERLLNGQGLDEDNTPEYETADLESLLSELEAMDDGDIQEISDLLDKAENNEAADPEIMDLLNMQEEVDETPAYDVMDLFSAEGENVQKESLLKRLLAKFKKKDKEVEEEQPVEKKEKQTEKKKKEKAPKEKKVKEKKKGKSKKQKETATNDGQQILPELAESDILDDTLNGSDAIILELEKEEVAKEEAKIKEKPKKKEKSKKEKSPKKDSEASDGDEEKNKKPKKQKKKKEKKVKEKNIVLYDYGETPLTKKSVSFVFLVCLLLMLAVIALLVNYSGHANRRLAEEAFDEGDYLQCYQLLYGQHLNESQEVMFHQSKIHLKMDSLWNRYRSLAAEKQYLRSLDKLIQFVFEYPEINEYAAEWNCEDIVDETYKNVLDVLYDEYKLLEQDAVSIANIEDDVDYTRTLTSLVEKKENGMLKYPNMLPEEEEKIGDLED